MLSKILIVLFLFVTTSATAQTNTTVYFDFNSTELTNATRTALDEFIAFGYIRSLGIFGHTDQMGTKEYNDSLSIERARRVREYLLEKGLDRSKIAIVRGFGTDRLISNETDEGSRQLNRRVVLMNGYKPTAMDSAVAAKQSTLTYNPGITARTKQPLSNSDARERAVTPPPTVTPRATITKREEPIVKQQKNEKLVEDIKDKNTKAGENIVLKNINFHSGSHSFLPSATPALEDLVDALKKIPSLEIEIQGHVCCQDGETDAIDNATGEQVLSVNRAKAVYSFLIEKGINKSRLSYKGLAHQYPLIKPEVTEEDRIANRRVEIKIIKK